MNKQAVDKLIPDAYQVLSEVGIAKNGSIDRVYRGYISTFGAAVTMGSLRAAVAFFFKEGANSKKDKTLLMKAIYKLVSGKDTTEKDNLLTYVCANNEYEIKEDILNAAIALKLSMNMFKLEAEEK